MKTALAAALAFVCLSSIAQARPSPYPPVTQYDGDRISARQVVQIQPQRHAKRHRHYRHHSRQRAPVVRQIAAAEGMTREVERASTGRPRAWCGWWLGHHLGMPLRSLWLARNWASVGASASPALGVVVVWRHHVGVITGRQGNRWVIKSGNDGHRVRERARSLAGAIAFRRV